MAHARESIRTAIQTAITGLTLTTTNVFTSRVYPLETASLPGLLLYTVDENSELASMGGTLSRVLTVMIEAVVRSNSGDIDDVLDDIAEDVEDAISGSTTLAALVLNTVLVSTSIEFDADGSKPIGTMKMTYQILYLT